MYFKQFQNIISVKSLFTLLHVILMYFCFIIGGVVYGRRNSHYRNYVLQLLDCACGKLS
jgi:hypothetical protein